MPRPIVLIATTDASMAYALRASLQESCTQLGLRLEICPSAGGEEVLGVKPYRCVEELFDALLTRTSLELTDTLIVLDVGVELDDAFQASANKGSAWHPSMQSCAGVAVELMLRFPHIFPVFLSPAVPLVTDDELLTVGAANGTNVYWKTFERLFESLIAFNDGGSDSNVTRSYRATSLHFASPLDGGAVIKSILNRFTAGMRCWFDPSGLRTLVKKKFISSVFDVDKVKNASFYDRHKHVCFVIEDERAFAMLNAYAGYRFGRRAFIVSSFQEFDGLHEWLDYETRRQADVVIIRDIDLRFSDFSNNGEREDLKDINSTLWQSVKKVVLRDDAQCEIRVVSTSAGIDSTVSSFCDAEARLGQRFVSKNDQPIRYLGLKKPISSLFDLDWIVKVQNETVAARISTATQESSGRHSAPYLNLAIAESLIQQARQCKGDASEIILGALLASEAFEILQGMSTTTALEALLLMHKSEVTAEGEFPGVAQAVSIKARKHDIESTVKQLMRHEENSRASKMFLVKFWAELKLIYRNGEQFFAAEEANIQSLVNSNWLFKKRGSLRWVRKISQSIFDSLANKFVKITFFSILIFKYFFNQLVEFLASPVSWFETFFDQFSRKVKYVIVKVATSPVAWGIANLFFMMFWTLIYALVEWHEINVSPKVLLLDSADHTFWERLQIFPSVILSSITLQPMLKVDDLLKKSTPISLFFKDVGWIGQLNVFELISIFHLGFAYIFFGLLISMVYRKIVRG